MLTQKAMWVAAGAVAIVAQIAMAEPTEIVVRVISKDAKFVGTETGGAKIVLRDVESGKILAQGVTAGATGNTPRIMTDPHTRAGVLSDESSAKFSATIDIDRPRLISATATGPMSSQDRAITVSSTQWVVPGKPVNGGDAWVLELPGFIIDLEEALPATIRLSGSSQKLSLRAKITMQCGCPITPGGLWDANKLDIGVILRRGNKILPTVTLAYAGKPSTFSGEIEITQPGDYVVDLYAYAPWNGNTGVRRLSFRAR